MTSIRPISKGLAYPAAWLIVLGLGLGLGSLAHVERPIAPTDTDQRVVHWMIAHRPAFPILTNAARLVTRLGNSEVTIPGVVLVSGILVANRRLRDAGSFLVLATGGQLLATALKAWFRRDRPDLSGRLAVVGGYSFPSGHGVCSGVFVILAIVVIFGLVSPKHRALRSIAIASMTTLALLVASSRVWLGVHYLTDVLAGFALGLAWATFVAVIRYRGRKGESPRLARDA